jgi:hypothetical protein
MAGNMLTAYDVALAGTAGHQEGERRTQSAAEMAAYGDAAQTIRVQNRLARMIAETGVDDQIKQKAWQETVTNMLTGAPQPSDSPAAAAPPAPTGDPVKAAALSNAGMAIPTGPATTPNNLQTQQLSRNGMDMFTPQPATMSTTPQAPVAAPQPADPYDQLFKATSPGGQLYQQDPIKALKLNDEIKTKRSVELWDKLKMATESGKIDLEQQKAIQAKMEPIIRATTPILQEYERQIAKGVPAEQARAAVQPAYEQMLAAMSQAPGYEGAAGAVPRQFNPSLAYLASDTYKTLGAQKLAETKEDLKLAEQTRSGMVTPKGKIIFTDKKGGQFVDGKPYTGPAIKPKVGATGGGGVGIPSEGAINHALTKGKPNDAVELLAQYFAFYGKFPPGMGRSKGGDAQRAAAMARVTEIARDAGMSMPELFAAGADVKANVAAMSKQKGLIANLQGSEAQAEKNLARLEGLYEKLGNGTIPVLNSVMNRFKKGLGAPEPGTAEAVAYETMIEYTRVVTRQTTGAAPTDSAMKNTNDLISVLRDNPAMIKQKFTQFRGLMKDSLNSQVEVYNEMKTHLGRGLAAQGPAPAAAPATTPPPPAPGVKIPATAQRGTYHGERAYTTDGGKSFFSEATGKRL